MKKFEVVIPEKRIEVVRVTYYIDAESEEQVKELLDDHERKDYRTISMGRYRHHD